MSDFLRDLSAKIGFTVDTEGLEKVNQRLEGMHRSLEIVAGAEILRGLFELAEKFSGMGEELLTAAASAGITTDAFQQLSYAAAQSGVSSDRLGFGLTMLSRQIQAVREGSDGAAETFGKIGISPEQLASFATSEDALKAVADRIAHIQDPIKRTQAAMKIFGRSGAQMVRFLAEGSKGISEKMSEASKVGAVVSAKQVEALAQLEDALSGAGAVIKATFATLATYVAPIIKAVVGDLQKLWVTNRGIIESKLQDWFTSLAYAVGFTVGIFEGLVQAFGEFANAFPNLTSTILAFIKNLILFDAAFSGVKGSLGLIVQQFNLFKGLVLALASPLGIAVVAVGALVAASHDLWVMWHGGDFWKDTWLGQGITALQRLDKPVLKALTGQESLEALRQTPEQAKADEERRAQIEVERQANLSTVGQRFRNLFHLDAAPRDDVITNLPGANNPLYNTTPEASVMFQNTFNIQAPMGVDASNLASMIKLQFDQSHTQMMQQARDVLDKPRVM